jgi:HPt (histidine-containing phosphotransfer) domain-containing protein
MEGSMSDELVYVEAMLARTMGNKSLAITLFKKLFSELPQQVAEIELAIAEKQVVIAQKKLHKLQGSLGFCGFVVLEKFAKNLESVLLDNNLEKACGELLLLVGEIKRFSGLRDVILSKLRG